MAQAEDEKVNENANKTPGGPPSVAKRSSIEIKSSETALAVANEVIKPYMCVCGKELQFLKDSKLIYAYGGTGTKCDSCLEDIDGGVYHCPGNASTVHKQGFDLCSKCVTSEKYKELTLEKFQKREELKQDLHDLVDTLDHLVQALDPEAESKKEEKLNDEEMDKELQELVSKYYLYEKQEEMKQEMKLSDVSKGPRHRILESFAKIPPDIPRLLIIGETGIGKSSFCNKMGGIYYKLVGEDDSSSSSEDEDDKNKKKKKSKKGIEIICQEGQEEIFRSGSDQYSITQTTSWAEVKFLGDTYDEPKPLIIIDTPGLNDVNEEKAKEHRLDLQSKLAAMQRVDIVLILLGKQALGGGGRFTNSTFQMIGDIITVFGGNTHLYDHFVIGFSCCDEFDKNWKLDFDKKSKQWQDKLQSEFGFNQRRLRFSQINSKFKTAGSAVRHRMGSIVKNHMCHDKNSNGSHVNNDKNKNENESVKLLSKINENETKESKTDDNEKLTMREIPMYKLSNIQHHKRFNKKGIRRWSQYKEFEKLYQQCVDSQSNPLYSTDYVLMQKMKTAIERIQNRTGLTNAAALQQFKREIIEQKALLERAHMMNIEYLSSIPKNPLEGVISAGRAVGNSLLMGFACLVAAPVLAGAAIWDSDSSTASKAAQTIVFTPLALAAGAIAGTATILGGLGTGITSIGHGIKNSFQQEKILKQSVDLANEKKGKEHEIIDNVLNERQMEVKELSFKKFLYGNMLSNDFLKS